MVKTIKPIRPTSREKKRYLAYQVLTEAPVTSSSVKLSLQNALQASMGEVTYGAAGIQMIDTTSTNGIIRFHPSYADEVKAGLIMLQNIDSKRAAIQSVVTSGMIHKAQAKLANQGRK